MSVERTVDSAKTRPSSESISSCVMAEALSLNAEWNLHSREVSSTTFAQEVSHG